MAGPSAGSRGFTRKPVSSSSSRAGKRRPHDEISGDDHEAHTTVPASSSGLQTTDLTDEASNPHPAHKQRRVGPSTSTIPRTLPMEPHEELLLELKGKYSIVTASVISSSKIEKKVTSVLKHLGHVDMFSMGPDTPGVMMLHARAGDSNKMVTVMEVAKRRMNETGVVWYQYNRVYEVADEVSTSGLDGSGQVGSGKNGTQTVIEDTIMGGVDGAGGEENGEENEDPFESIQSAAVVPAIRDKPAADPKTTYMSMFLSRVPIPELQSKAFITLQTNAAEIADASKA